MEIQSWWMIKCRMDDCASSKNITAEPSKGCRLERCPSRIHPHNHSCRTIGALFHNHSCQRGVGQNDALRFCRLSIHLLNPAVSAVSPKPIIILQPLAYLVCYRAYRHSAQEGQQATHSIWFIGIREVHAALWYAIAKDAGAVLTKKITRYIPG